MQFDRRKRREFISLLGGAAVWPFAARAQQGERVRRVGVLMGFATTDPEAQAFLRGFSHQLRELGWTDGTAGFDYRAAPSKCSKIRCTSVNYSSTSSARASKVGGTMSPSSFEVLRLMTSSYGRRLHR